MSFDAHEERIRKIFAGDVKFIIPRNQRRYVWEKKQWKELLSDISYIKARKDDGEKDIEHFLGSFVLQEIDDKYEIIDGQQRITTLFIILSAICMCFNRLGNYEEHGKTRQYLSGNIGLQSQFLRLENESLKNIATIIAMACDYKDDFCDKEIFNSSSIDKTIDGNRRVVSCAQFYYEQFSKNYITTDELVSVRDIVLGMKVIHIASEDELDCYDIFEILNARGVDLEESELLKNYIFKYAQPEYTVDKAKEIWSKIEENMEKCNGNIEQFLSHFVTYRYYKPSKDEGVFRIIKANTDKTEVYLLLEGLLKSSKHYIYFYHPENCENNEIRQCLQFHKLINHRQFRPLFMALLDRCENGFLTEKQIINLFVYLKNFSFAFTVVMGYTSNIIDTKIHELSRLVYTVPSRDSLCEVKDTLYKYYPSKDMFVKVFSNLGFSNKNPKFINSNNRKRVKYIMLEIERFFQKTSELVCNEQECNLEHIMNDSKTNDYVCMIGNILLISGRINEGIGDASFAEKKERYRCSKLANVQKFLSFYSKALVWDVKLIEQRTARLAELSYMNVWRISI